MLQYLPFASINGEIIPSEELPIPQKGKGVFTTIKILQSTPLFLENHISRLQEGAKYFRLKIPDFTQLKKQINDVLSHNKLPDAAIRVTLFPNNLLLHERALPPDGDSISAITTLDKRTDRQIKAIDRRENNQALEEAKKAGFEDALFIDNQGVSESTFCNVFSLTQSGHIITPPLSGRGLNGICRQVLMKYLPVKEDVLSPHTATPLVLTNCLRVRKVAMLDGQELPDGEPLLQTLQATMQQAEKEYRMKYA